MTETWDYSSSKAGGMLKMFGGRNTAGIEKTLTKLRDRYAG